MKRFRILLIATGGTLEKSYDARLGQLTVDRPMIDRLVAEMTHPDVQIEILRLMAKDSLDMVADDRRAILETVQARMHDADAILIIHGTDTLPDTSALLAEKLREPPVPVVLTGAMVPYACEASDALQNVSQALIACRLLAAGVHVVFHGKVLDGARVCKNHKALTFDPADC